VIRSAVAGPRPFKLFDRDGPYLLVQTTGSKLWRFKHRFSGVERLISLGAYPEAGLRQAREKRDSCRRMVGEGRDPSRQRRAAKLVDLGTFEQVALLLFAPSS